MNNIKLLDCTLRDGGFINDWEFGHDNICVIFERLINAKIDIVEIGFIDERRIFDRNRTIMPDTYAINEIFKKLETQNSMIVGMIDYGTCGLDKIAQCEDTFIDGIRVIFKKKNRIEAIAFCGELKKKGYKVFVQPVSITSYSDEEMLSLVELVNELQPYAMSIVDTYGLLHKNNLFHYFNIINKYLNINIGIGYHSHNNFQLAYANSIELLSVIAEQRQLIIDGSIYGMGKGAGNANVELLAMYMNDNCGKKYDINQLLELIDGPIMKIYLEKQWGYSLRYYLAASNDCHPKYVQYLMQKQTLSVKSINEILSNIDKKEKLSFNQDYIEKLYILYQHNSINDERAILELTENFKNKEILVIGPGRSMEFQKKDIEKFIDDHKPLTISINISPSEYHINYIFLSNSKRYSGLVNRLKEYNETTKIIATSNVTVIKGKFDYTIDYSKFIDVTFRIIDNSLLMLLRLLIKAGVKKVTLAGFDGYAPNHGQNYFDVAMEYIFTNEQAEELNEYARTSIKQMQKQIEVNFITKSYYNGDKFDDRQKI